MVLSKREVLSNMWTCDVAKKMVKFGELDEQPGALQH